MPLLIHFFFEEDSLDLKAQVVGSIQNPYNWLVVDLCSSHVEIFDRFSNDLPVLLEPFCLFELLVSVDLDDFVQENQCIWIFLPVCQHFQLYCL